jgi:hypothetical protein
MPLRCSALAALAGRAVAGPVDRLEFIVFHSASAFALDRQLGPVKQHAVSRLSRMMLEISGSPTHSGRLMPRKGAPHEKAASGGGAGAGAGAVGTTDSARVEREHDKHFLFAYCRRLVVKQFDIETEQRSAGYSAPMTVLAVVPLSPATMPTAATATAAGAGAGVTAADDQSGGFALSEILAMFDERATRTLPSADPYRAARGHTNVLPCSILLACPPLSCYSAGVGKYTSRNNNKNNSYVTGAGAGAGAGSGAGAGAGAGAGTAPCIKLGLTPLSSSTPPPPSPCTPCPTSQQFPRCR